MPSIDDKKFVAITKIINLSKFNEKQIFFDENSCNVYK